MSINARCIKDHEITKMVSCPSNTLSGEGLSKQGTTPFKGQYCRLPVRENTKPHAAPLTGR